MKRKVRMGRPPLKPGTAKLKNLVIRVSDLEFLKLSKKAKKAGVSVSAYVMAPHRKNTEN